jgi:hypothetical protein
VRILTKETKNSPLSKAWPQEVKGKYVKCECGIAVLIPDGKATQDCWKCHTENSLEKV